MRHQNNYILNSSVILFRVVRIRMENIWDPRLIRTIGLVGSMVWEVFFLFRDCSIYERWSSWMGA